jgi:hypothetical protein
LLAAFSTNERTLRAPARPCFSPAPVTLADGVAIDRSVTTAALRPDVV